MGPPLRQGAAPSWSGLFFTIIAAGAAPSAIALSQQQPSSPMPSPATTAATNRPFQPLRIDHVVIRCRNFRAMFDFYTDVLGCQVDDPDHVGRFGGSLSHLRAGPGSYIDLLSYGPELTSEGRKTTRRMHSGGEGYLGDGPIRDVPFSSSASTMDHFCIRVEPFDEAATRAFLRTKGVDVTASGQRLGADGVGMSLYVKDPEGNVVELNGGPVSNTLDDAIVEDMTSDSERSAGVKEAPQFEAHSKGDNLTGSYSQRSLTDTTEEVISLPESQILSATPCTRICRYNRDFFGGQVCIGCFREAFEIGTWDSMTPKEKAMALRDAADRCPGEEGDDDDRLFEGSVSCQELLLQAQKWDSLS